MSAFKHEVSHESAGAF